MFKVTINGREVAGSLASMLMQVFNGMKVNGKNELQPVTIKARYNALAELVKNDAIVKTLNDNAGIEVEIVVPDDFKLTCKAGNLVNTAKLHLAMLDLKQKATALKIEASKLYNEVNLKPVGQRGRKAEVMDVDSLADELTSILEG